MLLRALRCELFKCRHAPVWLAFFVCQFFPLAWAHLII